MILTARQVSLPSGFSGSELSIAGGPAAPALSLLLLRRRKRNLEDLFDLSLRTVEADVVAIHAVDVARVTPEGFPALFTKLRDEVHSNPPP